jgi:hypothetical protein
MKARRTLRSLGEGGRSRLQRISQDTPQFAAGSFIALASVVMQGTAILLLTRALKIEAGPSKDAKSRLPLDPWETDKPMR